MDDQTRQERFRRRIWADQLPPEEKTFLYAFLNTAPSDAPRQLPSTDASLYLAEHARRNGFRGCDAEQTAALQDILRANRLKKLRKIPAISGVLRLLNENGIVPVLVKGAAFLCYYAPELPRMMEDIDFYVPPEQFDRAVSLIIAQGFRFVYDTGYHVAVTSEALDMDIHRTIYKNGGDRDSALYSRTISCSFLGCRVAVPAPEDMLVHQLVNRGQDLSELNHIDRHLKWLVDCRAVLDFFEADPASILREAEKVNNLFYARLTLEKLCGVFPDRFTGPCPAEENGRYVRFLRCTARRLRQSDRVSTDSLRGIRYICRVCRDRWAEARLTRLVSGSRGTVLGVLLRKNGIDSLRSVADRLKRFAANSRTGGGAGSGDR